jgi:hypothetical protein
MLPSELQTCRTFFLISGIINIVAGLSWLTGSFISGIATCGVGCLLGFIPVVNIVCCVTDFIAYNKLSALNQTNTYGFVKVAAIVQIVSIVSANLVSMIFGIMILSNIEKENVKSYLHEKGIF